MTTIVAETKPGTTPVRPSAEVGTVALPAHYNGEQVLSFKKSNRISEQLVSLRKRDSADAERYRRLRHSVEKLKQEGRGLVLGITSPLPGDGKTFTSINLAGALAQNPDSRVLLIELDVRQQTNNVKHYLGSGKLAGTGVVDMVLDDNMSWDKATYYLSDFNLYVLPSGRETRLPYELLTSKRMGEVLQEARQRYDYVIIDTAPVVLVSDSQLIAEWVDGFLVVISADVTSKKMLEEALTLMDQNKVLGLVFNGYSPVGEGYGGYY
jgi:capsular exopolysaccharide synthesis family protein